MDCLSLYLHIPFCQHRCGYCDFNTYAGIDHLIPSYVDAMVKEISLFAENARGHVDLPVYSVYFGGGTPSYLPPEEIGKILLALNKLFRIDETCEITLEVNPGTVSQDKLEKLLSFGINRLSIGVQSTNQFELELLERLHGFAQVCATFEDARAIGFKNISLDLIYGLPEQDIKTWEKSLKDVIGLQPEHVSLYALTVEEGTPLAVSVKSGAIPNPDPDRAADCYELACDFLREEGFSHYEISNWAKNGLDGLQLISRHNRQYWMNQPYVGFGAGAHGFIGGYRVENLANPFRYIRQVNQANQTDFPFTPATATHTKIDKTLEMQETMMMGLRLLSEGVSSTRFKGRFGLDMQEVFSSEIDRLLGRGLVRWGGVDGNSLILTEQAYLIANQVFLEFI